MRIDRVPLGARRELALASTDISRRWSGPNECKDEERAARRSICERFGGAAPSFHGLPVGLTSTSVSRPSSPTRKLETELSPPFVANRKRRSGVRMTLPAPSNALGALSWPLIGLNSPEPAPPVLMRSTSVIAPFADRLIVDDCVPNFVGLHVEVSRLRHSAMGHTRHHSPYSFRHLSPFSSPVFLSGVGFFNCVLMASALLLQCGISVDIDPIGGLRRHVAGLAIAFGNRSTSSSMGWQRRTTTSPSRRPTACCRHSGQLLVLHHDEPALQDVSTADCARRHLARWQLDTPL